MKLALMILVFLMISGCSIQQEVRPLPSFEEVEICIIQNPGVKADFVVAYEKALLMKGYSVKILESKSNLKQCIITSTYNAIWKWDLALYMQYAKIKIFRNGKTFGAAIYDATLGGGRPDKFVNAADKINELVDKLFNNNGKK